jgi:phosphoribosylanthranilate isomerase
MKTRIKVCGVTTTRDAVFAAAEGADFIGVIFAESPRRIDTTRAREIRDAVPHAMLVGVFVDAPIDVVADTAAACALDFIQLHGEEPPEYCDALRERAGLPIIKAFRPSDIPDTERLGRYRTTSYFLFDLDKSQPDPLGELWSRASQQQRQGFRIFIAGALDASNVREAMGRTSAYCVDVCRGVEDSPGVKNHDAIRRFISEVQS